MALVGIVSTTDVLSVTTESLKILSTTLATPTQASNVDEFSTDIGQMAKLITVPTNAITTIAPTSFVHSNEASTTSSATTIVESDDSNNKHIETDSSKTAANTKAHASVDATKNNVQDTGSILMGSSVSDDESSSTDGPTMKNENANTQRIVSINDVTNGPTTASDAIVDAKKEDATKPAVSTSTSANIIKVNDRSRVVSKDDIESIRGRALNFSSNDHQQSMPGGVIYVTAPPLPSSSSSPSAAASVTIDEISRSAPVIPVIVKPKSAKAKSFGDDLSDVSMDNDGPDFHSSEHVAIMTTTTTTTTTTTADMSEMKTTTLTPLIHYSQCQSKVRI